MSAVLKINPPTQPKVEQEDIEREYQNIVDSGVRLHGKESDILRLFKMWASTEHIKSEDRIPIKQEDTIVYEMAFKFGRADIVVFHIDGSASVIEVKDGTKGYGHVVAGIGQSGLYAAQLAMNKNTLTKVRKCLLWTATGNLPLDALIETVCEQANVVPLPWGKLSFILVTM